MKKQNNHRRRGLICRIIGGFLCALILTTEICSTVFAETQKEPQKLYSSAAVLMDAESGRILYGKNADERLPMASTTKIMTCIVILEQVSLDETLTVSSYAASMPKVKLYIKKGEEYTVKDLLYSLMLESHNDSAVALAEYVGKKYLAEDLRKKPTEQYTQEESKKAVEAFAVLMNDKATQIGCENTWFITPNGLDASEEVMLPDGTIEERVHSTTAGELAKIMAYCIRSSPMKEEFLKITRTKSHSFYANKRNFNCNNHNSFLTMMEGALSGKTGFTNKAGYCYVGSLKREGKTLIVALLACGWPNHKSWKWSDTRKLMQYGLDHYEFRSFHDPDIAFDAKKLSPVPVVHAKTDSLDGITYMKVCIQDCEKSVCDNTADGLLLGEEERIEVEYHVQKILTAPVKKGTVIGTILYQVDQVIYKKQDIVAEDDVEAIDFGWCLEQIKKRFLL